MKIGMSFKQTIGENVELEISKRLEVKIHQIFQTTNSPTTPTRIIFLSLKKSLKKVTANTKKFIRKL